MKTIDIKKFKKIKIGENFFYKDPKKKTFYSKKKNISENTFNKILTEYKGINFIFL